jgi:hypothetical protein
MLWGSSILVGATGIVLGIMKYFMAAADPYAVVNHPLQPLMLKVHIVSAPLLVFAIGIVFVNHIWKQWRAGLVRGRVSGLWTLLTFAPMVFSGYLIQSVTHEGWLLAMVTVHLVSAIAFLLGFVAHQAALWVFVWKRKRRTVAARTTNAGSPVREL